MQDGENRPQKTDQAILLVISGSMIVKSCIIVVKYNKILEVDMHVQPLIFPALIVSDQGQGTSGQGKLEKVVYHCVPYPPQ